ncbi:MAG: hypothetical protein IT330_15325 [Anaerolineae bacterium]|nr:hypothetical protein [Anaerolineae bacterium]
METVAFLLAAVAVVVAIYSVRRANTLENRLARYNSLLYESQAKAESLEERLQEEILGLRTEIRRRAGEIHFTPTMTIAEARAMHPLAQQMLASFHLGGCASCAVNDTDTIASVCAAHGINQEALLSALASLTAEPGKGNGTGAQETLRLPNVQLHL